MALVNNLDKVAVSSSYPTDKIVKVFSGSFNTATSARQKDEGGFDYAAKLDLPHGYTRPVFTRLKWSRDGVTWLDGGQSILVSEPGVFAITFSDSTNVTILCTAFTGTLYYEVVCFWIDDYDGTDPLVEPYTDYTAKPFAFDSRLNYQKIIKQGEVTLAAPSGSTIVPHDAGVIPNAWVYFESNPGEVWPVIKGGAGNAWLYNYTTQREIEYSTSAVDLAIALAGGSGNCRVWYRIYAEGN